MNIVKSPQKVQTLIMCVIGMWLVLATMFANATIYTCTNFQYMYTTVVCFRLASNY